MIDKLEYLTVLAAERHFGRAAERLGITQPTLSAGLRQLEDRMGATLVNRGSRFQGMTPEGERVLLWARRILDDVRTMHEEVRATGGGGLSGHLRIGAVPTSLAMAASVTAPFRRKHPSVTCEILSMTSTEIVTGIAAFEIDVALTYLNDDRVQRFETRSLYMERYCLVCRRGDAMAERENVTWKEAASVPLGLLSRSMQNRQILNAHLGDADGVFEAVIESTSVLALLACVRTGDIATILPYRATAIMGLPEPLVAVPITDPDVGYEIGFVAARRDPRPPVLGAFWDESEIPQES